MNRASALFLLLLCSVALLAFYQALFPLPTSTSFIRFLGLSGFFLLCITLIIGPLSVLWPKAYAVLIEPRRATGIASFVFLLAHFLLVLTTVFSFNLAFIFSVHSNLTAFLAFLILIALTLTSNDFSIRVLGAGNWKNFQRLTYLAFVLAFAHFLLKVEGLAIQNIRGTTVYNLAQLALIALGIITILLQLAGFYVRIKRKAAAPA
ncbi:MAG: hypothetical protein Q7T16_04005 [Candidatus Burarchaeum sp.]|nr:hypothetical protein [Candidatus Burarchaeum sp.]MDO8339794.1 hypothetical protein [Candidatus Burarchaeum sp.]